MQITEERILPARERKIAGGGGHTDVDPHHTHLDLLAVLAHGCAVLGKDGRAVSARIAVHQVDWVVQAIDVNYGKHGAEYFLTGDTHFGPDVVQDGGSDE